MLLSSDMDKNTEDLLETVNFIKDYMVTNMATKEELREVEQRLEKKIDDGFLGSVSRMGAIDNRIDNETFARRDLENRVRIVLPDLATAPERV